MVANISTSELQQANRYKYTDWTFEGDFQQSYVNLWKKLTIKNICPNANHGSDGTLESVSIYQIIDMVGEGPIKGFCDQLGQDVITTNNSSSNESVLKGVYLNDVPVKNSSSDTLNFNRTFMDYRVGTHNQDPLLQFENNSLSFRNNYQTFNLNVKLPGLAPDYILDKLTFESDALQSGESEVPIFKKLGWDGNVAFPAFKTGEVVDTLKKYEKNQPVKLSHTISNDSVNALMINMECSVQIAGSSTGPNSVGFIIKVGYQGDEVLLGENGSVVYLFCNIKGIATSPYVRSYYVPLPPAVQGIDRQLSIFRVDKEPATDEYSHVKSLAVQTVNEVVYENLNYPHSAIIGTVFDARSFSNVPTRTYDLKLLKVKVPSNYDTESRVYTGDWDGTFSKDLKWTDNPAWILYDILTNKRYGAGKFGFKKEYLDKWNLYFISKYCDELVPTGNSGLHDKTPFTMQAEGREVEIDNSSLGLSQDELSNRFTEGDTVCLLDLNTEANGSGTALNTGYKRVIFNPRFEGDIFKFTLVEQPSPDSFFKRFASLKVSFLSSKQKNSAYKWILEYWQQNRNSNDSSVKDYISGKAIDQISRSGNLSVQYDGVLEILEPRFTCNIYLDKLQSITNVINDISAIFRGMIYWSNGYLFVSNDKFKEPIMLFNNSNVKDGIFNYSGSAKTGRHSAILVRYNDKEDSFKPKAEYIEDTAAMREYGYLLKEVVALGTTSKSQAHRIGKWVLYTNQTERSLVQFSSGIEASYLMPGDIIKIQDKLKSTKRYGGRVSQIDYGDKTVTLDKGVMEDIAGQSITLIVPKANTSVRQLNKNAKLNIEASFNDPSLKTGLSQSEVDSSRQVQIKTFTIQSVSDGNVVKILEVNDEDFNSIPVGSLWSIENSNAEYDIKDVQYRVVSISEGTLNDYIVTGMEYNSTKFEAIDSDKNLKPNQDSKTIEFKISDLPDPISSSNPTSDQITPSSLDSNYYDAYFSKNETSRDKALNVDFSQVITNLPLSDIGGYMVEVYKDGQKVRFALDGYDNTSFSVFLGDSNAYRYINYDIYVYDRDYKLESLGL